MNWIRKLFRKKVVKVKNEKRDHKEPEILENCEIIIDIWDIITVSGGNQEFEVYFTTPNGEEYKLMFSHVWDLRYCIENAAIDRFADFIRNEKRSSILNVKNSEYIKYFEQQVSGTLPIDELKDYIRFDEADTVLEILTLEKPKLIKLEEDGCIEEGQRERQGERKS